MTRFPFLVFVVGRRFWSKQLRKNLLGCFRFSAIVLSSSAFAKNCSELNGCTKTVTFEKPLCSRASPESPLDARKLAKVKLHQRALVGRFGAFLELGGTDVWVGFLHVFVSRLRSVSFRRGRFDREFLNGL